METQDAAETGGRGLKPIEWIAAVTGLLAVGTIIVVFFTVKVCDQQLAARYNEIRWTMPSGAARTRQMTEVMYEMISQLRNVDGFDVEGYLHSNDRGLRLAAVAYLYVNPDPAWARQLADAALSEDKPFNEYWSLQVLRMVLKGHCDALDDVTRSRLQDRLAELASTGADRAHQIRQLLRECPPRRRTTTP